MCNIQFIASFWKITKYTIFKYRFTLGKKKIGTFYSINEKWVMRKYIRWPRSLAMGSLNLGLKWTDSWIKVRFDKKISLDWHSNQRQATVGKLSKHSNSQSTFWFFWLSVYLKKIEKILRQNKLRKSFKEINKIYTDVKLLIQFECDAFQNI